VFTRNFRSTLSLHKTICPMPSGVNLGQVPRSRVLGNWQDGNTVSEIAVCQDLSEWFGIGNQALNDIGVIPEYYPSWILGGG
jgi:hypothetical protein